MALVHRVLGAAIVLALVVLLVWGAGLRIAGRDEAPTAFWGLQHYTENVLILQVVLGVVLLLVGRRVSGGSAVWLHYLYGSLFPLIAVIGGRIVGLRRDTREYVGLTWGAFFAWGLTMRALMTGCGDLITAIPQCLTGGM